MSADKRIQRWAHGYLQVGYYDDAGERPVVVQSPIYRSNDGEWVVYEDHLAAIRNARAEAFDEARKGCLNAAAREKVIDCAVKWAHAAGTGNLSPQVDLALQNAVNELNDLEGRKRGAVEVMP